MKEHVFKNHVSEKELNRFTEQGWTVVNIFPSKYTQTQLNVFEVSEYGVLLCREMDWKTKTEENRKRHMIGEKVREILERYQVPVEMITDDRTLYDMDLDSLDVVDFFMEIEKYFHIDVNEEEFDSTKELTIPVIIDYINSKL